jgi:diacylglycerol kinase (ATP)
VPRLGLVCNPRSGGGAVSQREIAAALHAHGADVQELPLERLPSASPAGLERIVVAGGDGTVAPAAAFAAADGLPLALLPMGTANDFARALGLPLDLDAACALAARGRRTRALDLAWMGGRPFVNAAGVGLSVAAAREAGPWKRRLGPLAYALGAARAAIMARPIRCRVDCDGERLHEGGAWQLIVANSGAFGGGSMIEEADPADGMLHLTVIASGPRLALWMYGYGLRSGRVNALPGVEHCGARRIDLRLPGPRPLNVDGELVGDAGAEISFRIEHGAVHVVVPEEEP